MGQIVPFANRPFTRKRQSERRQIVQAFVVADCMQKFHEFGDEERFLEMLRAAAAEVDTMSPDLFGEHVWWAAAILHARRNQLDVIDAEFARRFDVEVHHATTLEWAEKLIAGLPARYAEMLGVRP